MPVRPLGHGRWRRWGQRQLLRRRRAHSSHSRIGLLELEAFASRQSKVRMDCGSSAATGEYQNFSASEPAASNCQRHQKPRTQQSRVRRKNLLHSRTPAPGGIEVQQHRWSCTACCCQDEGAPLPSESLSKRLVPIQLTCAVTRSFWAKRSTGGCGCTGTCPPWA